MKKTLFGMGAVALLSLGSLTPALAYPAGSKPTLGLSSVSRITPGSPVSLQISRVKPGCEITVRWSDDEITVASQKAIVKKSGKSGVIRINTPSTAGDYTLSSLISKSCAGDAAITLEKQITVGKRASLVGKLQTTSAFASKSPTLSFTGTVKSGSVAVSNQEITISLKKNGTVVRTKSVTTDSDGALNVSFPGESLTTGDYTATVDIKNGAVYYSSVYTTSKLTLH